MGLAICRSVWKPTMAGSPPALAPNKGRSSDYIAGWRHRSAVGLAWAQCRIPQAKSLTPIDWLLGRLPRRLRSSAAAAALDDFYELPLQAAERPSCRSVKSGPHAPHTFRPTSGRQALAGGTAKLQYRSIVG
jgi:hypothetical protein